MEERIYDDLNKIIPVDKKILEKTIDFYPPENFGDFSIISKKLSKASGISAEDLVNRLKENQKSMPYISNIEQVAGYINFRYNYPWILGKLIKKEISYDVPRLSKGKRIMIEHTSVNPNKALHIGHIRNAFLGDTLYRMMKSVGYHTVVVNYIDDTGAQVADNIVGILYLGFPLEKKGVKIDHYLGGEVYVKVNKRYKEDLSLLKKRDYILKKIEEGNNEISDLARKMIDKVLNAQLQTLSDFGIFYDLLNYESHILHYGFWNKAFEQLKKLDLVEYKTEGEKRGCWVFRMPNGEEKILVRSNGTVVYAGKDIAYAMWKHGLLDRDFKYHIRIIQNNSKPLWETTQENGEDNHPVFNKVDTSINVIDVRQSYEQNVVREALKEIGKTLGKNVNYVHYAYGVVSLSDSTVKRILPDLEKKEKIYHMSGRKGIFINTDDVLSTLEEKIYEEVRKRNPNMNDEKLKRLSKEIAVSTIRWEMVKQNPKKMIIFDIDRVSKIENGTALYLMYAYARMNNLLKKAAFENYNISISHELNEYEKGLIKEITMFPYIVKKTVLDMNPSTLAEYLTKFAIKFNKFYENVPVIKSSDKEKGYRIELMKISKDVYSKGLDMFGISKPDRM